MSWPKFKRALLKDAVRNHRRTNDLAGLTVGRVMTPLPTCVAPDCCALELVKMFHDKRFRHLLVEQDDHLVGMISDRDLLPCFGLNASPTKDQLRSITAAQLMSTDLITVGPEMSVMRGLRLIIEHGINCLPVVLDNKPIGILTSTDLHMVLELVLDGDDGSDADAVPDGSHVAESCC